MALSLRLLCRNHHYLQNITQPVKWSIRKHVPLRMLASRVCSQNSVLHRPLLVENELTLLWNPLRMCSTKNTKDDTKTTQSDVEKKPGLIQRFKQMYRDYWYVLVPVHMATSAMWLGGFYYAVRSGIDVISLLESLGISEKLMEPLKKSEAGYFALTFALYKAATPLRYAVTLGGTTYAINKLTVIGWIKPVPSRERIKEMIQEKKDNIQDRFNESKQHYQIQIKEKQTQVIDEMKRYKTEMRNMKSKIKKM